MSAPSVWILNHYAQGPDLPGGTRHYELGRRLVARGWDVTVVASAFHHVTRTHAHGASRRPWVERLEGVRFVWVPSRTTYRANDAARATNMLEFALRAALEGRRRFRGAVPAPDVVVGSSPHLLTALAAQRLARRFRTPFVLEVRDLWPETIIQMGVLTRRHPLARLLARLERYLYGRAARIVSLLPAIGDYLLPLGVEAGKVSVVPNGVDVAAFGCPQPATAQGPLRIAYIGAHGPANGLATVLAAARLLEDTSGVEIHLTGDGPAKAALTRQAQAEGLRNVFFHDPVPKAQVPALLCHADCLLLNYARIGIGRYGISPNKLWEYMASGRPVLFAHEAAENPVEQSKCGLSVLPEEPKALARAMAELAALSPAERAEMGRRGREYVRAHHDWDLLAARFAGVLESVIARGVMGPRRERTTVVD